MPCNAQCLYVCLICAHVVSGRVVYVCCLSVRSDIECWSRKGDRALTKPNLRGLAFAGLVCIDGRQAKPMPVTISNASDFAASLATR